jgi:hypothetical protein
LAIVLGDAGPEATHVTRLGHDGPHFWQLRFHDFNVFSAEKLHEKLVYMHWNPVKRGLVTSPEQWPWSSYRHYAMKEPGAVTVNEGWKALEPIVPREINGSGDFAV